MMKVCYSEMDTPAGLSCRLEADGHAGYAPAGQDIVCAGASTVISAGSMRCRIGYARAEAMRLPGRTSFVQEPAP